MPCCSQDGSPQRHNYPMHAVPQPGSLEASHIRSHPISCSIEIITPPAPPAIRLAIGGNTPATAVMSIPKIKSAPAYPGRYPNFPVCPVTGALTAKAGKAAGASERTTTDQPASQFNPIERAIDTFAMASPLLFLISHEMLFAYERPLRARSRHQAGSLPQSIIAGTTQILGPGSLTSSLGARNGELTSRADYAGRVDLHLKRRAGLGRANALYLDQG